MKTGTTFSNTQPNHKFHNCDLYRDLQCSIERFNKNCVFQIIKPYSLLKLIYSKFCRNLIFVESKGVKNVLKLKTVQKTSFFTVYLSKTDSLKAQFQYLFFWLKKNILSVLFFELNRQNKLSANKSENINLLLQDISLVGFSSNSLTKVISSFSCFS